MHKKQKVNLQNFVASKKPVFLLTISLILVIIAILFLISKKSALITYKKSEVIEPQINYPVQEIAIPTPFDQNLKINQPIFPERNCSILDYGAVQGNQQAITSAIQKAVDFCASNGGGKVTIPSGTWLTGPIRLKTNINLEIQKDATLLFSTNFSDYLPVVFSRFEGIEYYNFAPPIYAKDAYNVAITGEGKINGQGEAWWQMARQSKLGQVTIDKIYAMGDNNTPLEQRIFGKVEDGVRQSFIEFINCKNVLIENVSIINGPMWTLHPVYSRNVIVRGVNVMTNPGPSTDGIAIDSSSNVLVENSTFNTGDDAIVIKSGRDKEGMRLHKPSENIVIRNNAINDSHAAIAIGSEMSGDVRNVFAQNNTVDISQYGFRIKAALGRGGIVENIWVDGLRARKLSIAGIDLDSFYGVPFSTENTIAPLFKNIHISSFSAEKSASGITIDGSESMPVQNVSLDNINISSKKGVSIKNAADINIQKINNLIKSRPLFYIENSQNVKIVNSPCPLTMPVCIELNGERTNGIDISNSGFAQRTKSTSLMKNVSSNSLIK